MISINKKAMVVVREILKNAEDLGCQVHKMDCGATVVDMGINCRGSWEAGLLFTRVTLGDLAKVQLGEFYLNEDY
jgi:methenyltetrahydromethanopterin cyclohydrolase